VSGRLLPALLLILAAAPPALAETYKWVDRNGTVNYSNKPPQENPAKAQRVAERISVVAADPSMQRAAAAMRERAERRAQYEEADWQRRRHFLLAAQPDAPADYAMGYGPVPVFYSPYSYGGAVFTAGVVRRSPPFFMHGSFSKGGRGTMHSAQGTFR
jgi:uncharacterized protein DUF4124